MTLKEATKQVEESLRVTPREDKRLSIYYSTHPLIRDTVMHSIQDRVYDRVYLALVNHIRRVIWSLI